MRLWKQAQVPIRYQSGILSQGDDDAFDSAVSSSKPLRLSYLGVGGRQPRVRQSQANIIKGIFSIVLIYIV
jgi:hypothetical protein